MARRHCQMSASPSSGCPACAPSTRACESCVRAREARAAESGPISASSSPTCLCKRFRTTVHGTACGICDTRPAAREALVPSSPARGARCVARTACASTAGATRTARCARTRARANARCANVAAALTYVRTGRFTFAHPRFSPNPCTPLNGSKPPLRVLAQVSCTPLCPRSTCCTASTASLSVLHEARVNLRSSKGLISLRSSLVLRGLTRSSTHC